MTKPLPPYGRQYLDSPPMAGLVIAIGPDAWKFARGQSYAVLVLPPDKEPPAFRWPSHRYGALVHERGVLDDELLTVMATELLIAGNPFVVAIREALLEADPRVFFYKEGASVAA